MTRARKFLLTAIAIGLLGIAAGVATQAAFFGTTSNAGNIYGAGTVYITDNDSGTAMLSLSSSTPGASDTGCIDVTYQGSLSSTVRLYGTISGTLAQYLTLTVTRGTDSSPSFDSCTNFTADSTNYIGSGAGVIYSGPLSNYPGSYGAGIVDPTSGSPETWTTNESHSYKFVVTLGSDPAAQAQSATATFTWEAANQ